MAFMAGDWRIERDGFGKKKRRGYEVGQAGDTITRRGAGVDATSCFETLEGGRKSVSRAAGMRHGSWGVKPPSERRLAPADASLHSAVCTRRSHAS
jgi:hypothetical protein